MSGLVAKLAILATLLFQTTTYEHVFTVAPNDGGTGTVAYASGQGLVGSQILISQAAGANVADRLSFGTAPAIGGPDPQDWYFGPGGTFQITDASNNILIAGTFTDTVDIRALNVDSLKSVSGPFSGTAYPPYGAAGGEPCHGAFNLLFRKQVNPPNPFGASNHIFGGTVVVVDTTP